MYGFNFLRWFFFGVIYYGWFYYNGCKSGTLKLWDPILYGFNCEVRSNFVWFQLLRCFFNCNFLWMVSNFELWDSILYDSNFEVNVFYMVPILKWLFFGVTIFCMFANVSLFYSVIMWNHKGVRSNYVWLYYVFSFFSTVILWNFETMISNSIWLCCNCL